MITYSSLQARRACWRKLLLEGLPGFCVMDSCPSYVSLVRRMTASSSSAREIRSCVNARCTMLVGGHPALESSCHTQALLQTPRKSKQPKVFKHQNSTYLDPKVLI